MLHKKPGTTVVMIRVQQDPVGLRRAWSRLGASAVNSLRSIHARGWWNHAIITLWVVVGMAVGPFAVVELWPMPPQSMVALEQAIVLAVVIGGLIGAIAGYLYCQRPGRREI